MSQFGVVQQTKSEEETLTSRGYRLLTKLGEGSYAKVYLGEFKTDKEVTKLACKIIDISKAPKEFVKKFLPRELAVLVKINHPHIIHVHSIFQRRNRYYIFMRFAEKGDLLDYITKNGAIVENQARVWVRQVALALQYLHTLDIAHRDLKCENVLVTANYNLKLSDFGFARFVTDKKGKRQLSETYCGSLSYAAPEILRGNPYHPKPADMWSFGIMVFTMVNKSMPFDDTNARVDTDCLSSFPFDNLIIQFQTLYDNQMKRNWKFRSKYAPKLSDTLKKFIGSLLEPDFVKRYTISDVVNGDWIAMDPRFKDPYYEISKRIKKTVLNQHEKAALQAATDEKKGPASKRNIARRSSTRTTNEVSILKADTDSLRPARSALNRAISKNRQ